MKPQSKFLWLWYAHKCVVIPCDIEGYLLHSSLIISTQCTAMYHAQSVCSSQLMLTLKYLTILIFLPTFPSSSDWEISAENQQRSGQSHVHDAAEHHQQSRTSERLARAPQIGRIPFWGRGRQFHTTLSIFSNLWPWRPVVESQFKLTGFARSACSSCHVLL